MNEPNGQRIGRSSPIYRLRPLSRKALSELVHRYVLANPLLDECIEEWGSSNNNGVEVDFWAMPSGELALVSVNGGQEGMHACVGDALAQIRLPAGSVSEAKMVTVSIR